MADRVVDVVVDVRDAIDDAHDLALERVRLDLSRVLENAVAHLPRQVQRLGDPVRLLVVAKAEVEALAQAGVELLLADVAERRVAHVVTEADGFGEVLVQLEGPGDSAGDRGRLERVRHASAEVVAGRVDEDLCLALQPPERLRVQDPVAIALERRAHTALGLLARAPARLVGTDRKRGQPALLVLANPSLEGVRHSPFHPGHLFRHVR